jgi:predicted metal-binding membrane protein
MFLLMVAAMMLPFAAPAARHVAKASFWRRRQRAAACYVLGFAAVWATFGLALFAAWAALPLPGADAGRLAATAAGAALWQGSRRRRRAAARCGNRPALPQRGLRATLRSVRAGGAFGVRCIPLCGPAMVMMAASPQPAVMLAVFAIQAYEWRRGPNPFAQRRWREPALAYAAMATLAAVVAAA